MSECRFYKVADHVFSVTVDGSVAGNTDGSSDFFARCMDNYTPFVIPGSACPGLDPGTRNLELRRQDLSQLIRRSLQVVVHDGVFVLALGLCEFHLFLGVV